MVFGWTFGLPGELAPAILLAMSNFRNRYLIPAAGAAVAGGLTHFLFPSLVGEGFLATLLGVVVTIGLVSLVVMLRAKGDSALLESCLNFLHALEGGQLPEAIKTERKDPLGEVARALNRFTNRDKAVQQANSDALTGLANRRGVLQKLDAAYKANKPLSLFYIDLDKFKPINDTYGHEAGDEVLRRVAALFTAAVREGDIVARLGGDEFLIILMGMTDRALLSERAQKMIDMVSEPMWVNDVRVKLGASIGITIAPEDGHTVEALMAAADETMYAVKKAGRNGFKFYS
jgi:diguanylate cyclase (GGDEF)-like protein